MIRPLTEKLSEIKTECLTLLALELNLDLSGDDYAILGKVGALNHADMMAVLAASREMAMLFMKLAVMLESGK